MRPPRDNRWKTNYEPGSCLVEVAERSAEAVEHSDLKEEEEVQWKIRLEISCINQWMCSPTMEHGSPIYGRGKDSASRVNSSNI